MLHSPIHRLLPLSLLALAACAAPPAPAEMSTEEAMARMTELATPGEGHARLEPLVGTFTSTMTMWLEPGAEPTPSLGTSTNRWILGGRYLEQRYQADFLGMPFEGVSTIAFDNASGSYQGTWIDNMSTWILPVSTGEWNPATRSITSYRTFTDPLTGLETTTRDVVRIVSDDEHHFEMHERKGDGEERQLFEIVYRRTN